MGKLIRISFLIFAGFCFLFWDGLAGEEEIHPLFGSLEEAKEYYRKLKVKGLLGQGEVRLRLRKGNHFLDESFILEDQDSGPREGRVVYCSEEGGRATLIGGTRISPSHIGPVTSEEIKERLPKEIKAKVLEIDLEKLGIKHTGPFPDLFGNLRDMSNGGIVDLYFRNERLPLAQWPNGAYSTIKKVVQSGHHRGGHTGIFEYRGERPKNWLKAVDEGLWVKGFWRVPWVIQTIRVGEINPQDRTITHAVGVHLGIGSKYTPMVNGTRSGDGKEPWVAINLVEELDVPGEWVIDFKRKKIYLYPPDKIREGDLLIADLDAPMVLLKNCKRVRLENLIFEGGLGEALRIEGGRDNEVAGSTFKNIGNTAVVISGENNGIRSCDLKYIGAYGIKLQGGNRRSLLPGRNYAINNHIHHCGEVIKIVSGMDVQGVGQIVRNNLIHDITYGGISYGGNDHVMEYNEIHNLGLDGGDLGAFYSTGDWASAGTTIRGNLVHHLKHGNAFYMDDGHGSDLIQHNIVYKAASGGFIGGGHDNRLLDNLFIHCQKGIHFDSRGVPRKYTKKSRHLYPSFQKYAEGNEIYKKKYPNLHRIPEENPSLPTGNRITHNVVMNGVKPMNFSGKPEHFKDNVVEANDFLKDMAGLKNPERLDFSLVPEAPKGLKKRLSWLSEVLSNQGLKVDEFRKHLPSEELTQPYEYRSARRVFDSEEDMKASNKLEKN